MGLSCFDWASSLSWVEKRGGSCGTAPQPTAGVTSTHVCPGAASWSCLDPTCGLCCRSSKHLQGWSSSGSPALSASPGCLAPFHKRTCSSPHLPCTFSGNRFSKSGRWTPQGDGPVRPKAALSAQQMGSPWHFPGCSRRLGGTEQSSLAEQHTPFLPWGAEPRY